MLGNSVLAYQSKMEAAPSQEGGFIEGRKAGRESGCAGGRELLPYRITRSIAACTRGPIMRIAGITIA